MDFDLTEFFTPQASSEIPNHDWYTVDRDEAASKLPMQNLDMVPDLAAQWAHRGESSVSFVQNTGGPASLYELGSHRNVEPVDLKRDVVGATRVALMESTDPSHLKKVLTDRFPMAFLAAHKDVIAAEVRERGLLGKLYIAAEDFPNCATESGPANFVRKHAAMAPFVRSKEACGGCTHNANNHCGVFNKQIVLDVPYTPELAAAVEQHQTSLGFEVKQASTDPKARIKQALLASLPTGPARVYSGLPAQAPQVPVLSKEAADEALIQVSALTRKKYASASEDPVKQAAAAPIVTQIEHELLRGKLALEVARGLFSRFDRQTLLQTRTIWEPTLKTAGVFGLVVSKQTSFDDCHEGASFLAKHASPVRAIVAGEKCRTCVHARTAHCNVYDRALVASLDDVLVPQVVAAVREEMVAAKKIPSDFTVLANESPSQALSRMQKVASVYRPVIRAAEPREWVVTGHYGSSTRSSNPAAMSETTKAAIVKTARRYLNEGLYGHDLVQALRATYQGQDVVAAKEAMRPFLKEQGLQGVYYVDPTVYEDYGRGCQESARKHRSRQAVRYVKAGDKCGSCIAQSMPGYCSVMDKALVNEPPYQDKTAQQKAILESGRATKIDLNQAFSQMSMLDEFQVKQAGWDHEWNAEAPREDFAVEIGQAKVKL